MLSIPIRHYGEVNALLSVVIVVQMDAMMLLAMACGKSHVLFFVCDC